MTPHESPLAPLFRFLLSSFRIGRFFGTEVRVYGAALIFVLLVLMPLPQLSFLASFGDRLLYVLLGILTLYLSVYFHEMGHALAGRRYHIKTPLITLSPLGGLAHMQGAAPSPRADIVISAAGPVTHLLTLAVVWPLSHWVGGQPFSWAPGVRGAFGMESGGIRLDVAPYVLDRLVELNLGMLLFNLLPVFPLDGGRIFRSLLALRMHPNRATLIAARIGMVGAVVMGLVGLFGIAGFGGGVLVAIAITGFMACQRAVLEARHSDGPYGETREPWEEDPDAWKLGGAAEPPPPRPRLRTPRPPERQAPAGAELDRLLDRVKEVGVAGLTESERAALLRASEARRGH